MLRSASILGLCDLFLGARGDYYRRQRKFATSPVFDSEGYRVYITEGSRPSAGNSKGRNDPGKRNDEQSETAAIPVMSRPCMEPPCADARPNIFEGRRADLAVALPGLPSSGGSRAVFPADL